MAGRIMAIDYGNKRVGFAVTDVLQLIPNLLTTVPAHKVFDFMDDYLGKESVDEIVVGDPKTLNNLPSENVKYVGPFVNKLKKRYPSKKIILMDERFTSKLAMQSMREGGLRKKQRQDKKLVDAVSATILLQSYLEYKRFLENNQQ